MVVSSALSPDELISRPRLLGDGGDLDLLDGRGVGIDALRAVILDADAAVPLGVLLDDLAMVPAAVTGGAVLVHVPAALGPDPALGQATRSMVVAIAGDLPTAHLVALDIVAAGGNPRHLLVEVPVSADDPLPTAADVEVLHRSGMTLGAHLVTGGIDAEATGWEIGALAGLLTAGVRTIRGVRPRRFRRVRSVVGALAAAEDPGR